MRRTNESMLYLRWCSAAVVLLFLLSTTLAANGQGVGTAVTKPASSESVLPLLDKFDIVVVLGASIYQNTKCKTKTQEAPCLEYLPVLSPESRATAGAVVYELTHSQFKSHPVLIFSGGYNIGVRYNIKGVPIAANTTVAAFATARNYASEAQTMKLFIEYNFPTTDLDVQCMVEEESINTLENALFR